MTTATKITIILSCSLLLFACQSSQEIVGTYHSKFAEVMMFGTTIRLRPDSTLNYVFQGDLLYDSATGHYQVRGNKVFVNFDPEAHDSTKLNYRYDDMPLRTTVYRGVPISYKLLLYPGHHKLFPAYVGTDKKISRARRYNRHKKFILFGSHYYRRRFYYKLRE